jgi:hypothetical protein
MKTWRLVFSAHVTPERESVPIVRIGWRATDLPPPHCALQQPPRGDDHHVLPGLPKAVCVVALRILAAGHQTSIEFGTRRRREATGR